MYQVYVLCVTTWDYQVSVLFSLWTYKAVIRLLLATPNMGCGEINDSVLRHVCVCVHTVSAVR